MSISPAQASYLISAPFLKNILLAYEWFQREESMRNFVEKFVLRKRFH